MPKGFFRRNGSYGFNEVDIDFSDISDAHPVMAGRNYGIGNYVPDPTFPGTNLCDIYTEFVNVTTRALYPDPQGALRKALTVNLENFFQPVKSLGCTQLFPFGK